MYVMDGECAELGDNVMMRNSETGAIEMCEEGFGYVYTSEEGEDDEIVDCSVECGDDCYNCS